MHPFQVRWLGRIAYSQGLTLQEQILTEIRQGKGRDTLLLLEHEPVYTIGRTQDRSSLGPSPLPHPLVEISRGGQATYHGPGQLVGYPILDLQAYGRDLHSYLRALEESLIALCASFSLPAHRWEGMTGVWIEDRKLASIGIGVRHWISQHGFALNVLNELAPFEAITPCGLDGVHMTSLHRELASRPLPSSPALSLETIAEQYPEYLARELAKISH